MYSVIIKPWCLYFSQLLVAIAIIVLICWTLFIIPNITNFEMSLAQIRIIFELFIAIFWNINLLLNLLIYTISNPLPHLGIRLWPEVFFALKPIIRERFRIGLRPVSRPVSWRICCRLIWIPHLWIHHSETGKPLRLGSWLFQHIR